MDKIAQRRSLLNKLHEMANVPARSAEEFFKPELKRVMGLLTDADDVVRSNLLGSKVGKASAEDPVSAKDLLKEAKSFINRREYLSAVANLGRFHKKMQDVANILESLKINVDGLHHQFLFNKLPGKHREQLESLRSRFASDRLPYFTKEAGIMDFFHNIGTQRGRALAAWEKRYPKIVGKIRDGAIVQLEASQDLLNTAVALLKTMASHRAGRNIDAYLETGKELSDAFKKYDMGGKNGGFRGFYNNVIKPYMDAQLKMESEPNPNIPVPTPTSTQTVNAPPMDGAFTAPENPDPTLLPPPPGLPATPQASPPTSTIPSPAPAPQFAPEPTPPENEEIPKSEQIAQQLKMKGIIAQHNFLQSLEVFNNEDPRLLANYISKYAQSIQSNDPNTAIKLFGIVKSLRG
jgi:hypothetical protein